MPRPSLKSERTEAILDAIEHCVIRDGIKGITLESIAEEAGLRRSLLRHNVGNREQLIEAFLDRFFARSDQAIESLLAGLPDQNRIPVLLDLLFDESEHNHRLTLVALALTAAAAGDRNIRRRLREWNKDFVAVIAAELHAFFPASGQAACDEVAAGLVGIYFNAESLTPLGSMTALRQASQRAAERLINTLET